MAIPVCVTQLIGTFLETLGYGIYVVVLPTCIEILRKRNLHKGLMYYLFATTVINFVFITMHLIADLIRAFVGFTGNMDLPGSPEKYFANTNTTLAMTKTVAYVSVTLVADALLVYRTFVIWGRKLWVSVVPVFLFGLVVVMSVWFTWALNKGSPGSGILASVAFKRSKYFYASTLAVNLICTFLIAFRIWTIQRRVKYLTGPGPNRKYTLITVILESAAIHTASLCCLIGTSVADNSAMFFFLNPMPPIIGSVFSYVIIRSSMDNRQLDIGPTTQFGADHESGRSQPHADHNMHDQPRGIVVHLEQIVHHDMKPVSGHGCSYMDTKSYV